LLKPIVIILLLGSYDPETKSHLESIKEEIAKVFSGESVYAFLLDSVEIYHSDIVEVLTELSDKDKATLFIFKDGKLVMS
jgi:thymidine kinase